MDLLPISVLTDSYKAGHYAQYPPCKKMVAYGEFRRSFDGDPSDTRFVFFGIRYIVEKYLNRKWTVADVEAAEKFYSTHNLGHTPYPYPKELFLKFIRENDGYFPIRLEALPEGTVANVHVPVYQITAEGEYAPLCTFFETILTHVWYPTTVATLSRRCKEVIQRAFDISVEKEMHFLVNSRLHDFGFRGCTTLEQSVLGGCAHLLNFNGTDTMSAAYYAQFVWNEGRPVGESIPATEHSVMTSWPNEKLAIENMLDKFGAPGKLFSVVMDSYDYNHALNEVFPSITNKLKQTGATLVLRPDSGDPPTVVLQALHAADRFMGSRINKLGYKVLNQTAVIQGDGISFNMICKILDTIMKEGYSAQNVAYGMGGGLLQKVNRDTMSFATKLCHIKYADGRAVDVMKKPKDDLTKVSLPGILQVRKVNRIPTIFPREDGEVVDPTQNLLKVVYDKGPVSSLTWDNFDTVRNRVETEWKIVPKTYDPISGQLKEKIKRWIENFDRTHSFHIGTN
jgi:nicotinic acid phosphoribosyltransferase